ncbi:MAG: hypothetical protein IJJ85_01700 [Clostridia bacterium]|nr:hypothetical protein [Clostridia bacterium]
MKKIQMLTFRVLPAVLVFCCISLFSACGAAGTELSRRLIVEAIGVDRTDTGVEVTLQTLDLHAVGQGENGKKTAIFTLTGTSVSDALAKAPAAAGLTPLYARTRVLVLGETAIGKDVSEILACFLRMPDIRLDIRVCAAEKDAKSLIGADLGAAVTDAEVIEDVLAVAGKRGAAPEVLLYRLRDRMLSREDAAYCPVLGVTKAVREGETETVKIAGTAFFSDDGCRYLLPQADAPAFLLLTGQYKKGNLTVPTDRGDAGLEILSAKTAVFGTESAGTKGIRIRAVLSASLTEAPEALSGKELETAAAQALAGRLRECFDTLGKNRIDVLRIGRRLLFSPQKYPSPDEIFQGACRVAFDIKVKIRSTGTMALGESGNNKSGKWKYCFIL